jgi:hypothetical protein
MEDPNPSIGLAYAVGLIGTYSVCQAMVYWKRVNLNDRLGNVIVGELREEYL